MRWMVLPQAGGVGVGAAVRREMLYAGLGTGRGAGSARAMAGLLFASEGRGMDGLERGGGCEDMTVAVVEGLLLLWRC